jgi:hypothetical protein
MEGERMLIKKFIRGASGLAIAAAAVVLFAAPGTARALDVEAELKGLKSAYCKKVSGSNKVRLEKCIEAEKKAKKKLDKERKYSLTKLLCKRKLSKNLSYVMLETCIASKERPKVKKKTSRKGEVVPFPNQPLKVPQKQLRKVPQKEPQKQLRRGPYDRPVKEIWKELQKKWPKKDLGKGPQKWQLEQLRRGPQRERPKR